MNSAMVSLNRFWISSMLPMFAICNSSRIFSRRALSSGVRFLLAMCNTSCLLFLFYTSQQVYTNYGIVSGAQYTIPPTKNLLHPWKYDRQIYKRRNVIERCFCRLKDFRRISTRYDKRADSFQAFLFLAASAVIFSILHI